MLVDPSNGEPTKILHKYLEDGTKVRVSKKSGHIIPKPDPLLNRIPRSTVVGAKDTKAEDVFEVTFDQYEEFLPYVYASENDNNKKLLDC
jgi:large subunit ribosomal protein L24